MKTTNERDLRSKNKVSRLVSDLDPQHQAELGDLTMVENRLESFVAPEPTDESRERLSAALDARQSRFDNNFADHQSDWLQRWIRLMRAQQEIIDAPFWWVCALVFLLGLALAIIYHNQTQPVLFALFAPIVASIGVAYAFRPATKTMSELEKATPTPLLALFYARFSLVMVFNGILSLVLISVLWISEPQLVLWRLLIVWIGPMLALGGGALFVTLKWGSLIGLLAPVFLWTGVVFLRFNLAYQTGNDFNSAVALFASQINGSDPLLVSSLLALVFGIVLVAMAGHQAELRFQ